MKHLILGLGLGLSLLLGGCATTPSKPLTLTSWANIR